VSKIHSGQRVLNFIRIDWVFGRYDKNHFGAFFGSQCIYDMLQDVTEAASSYWATSRHVRSAFLL